MHHKSLLSRSYLFIFNIIFICLTGISYGQSIKPGINFQAVARDKEHNAASNRKIYIDCTIENGQSNPIVVYGEHQDITTNDVGIFNLIIGNGTRYVGATDIYNINWGAGSYFFHLKISITPINPDPNWDYNKDWIDLGAVAFGVVPYAIQSLTGSNGNVDTTILNKKLNISDTSSMLRPYRNAISLADSSKYVTPFQFASKSYDTSYLSNRINLKLNSVDTASMFNNRIGRDTIALSNRIILKLNSVDTATMLNNRIGRDTIALSNRINLKLNSIDTSIMLNNRFGRDTLALSNRINNKEDISNKSVDVSLVADYNDTKYPTVKAIKTYVDAALIAGAPDASTTNKGLILLGGDLTGTATTPTVASNSISTSKLQDASVTDAKLALGISSSKVGLGNVTNNAQLYNLNGLTAQVQSFASPGTNGLAPNWQSTGATHTINIPMAAASAVMAGLISKTDYDHFNSAYSNTINSITNNGNSGAASMSGNILNIPNYSLVGLAGNVNPNTVFAGPATGAIGASSFRNLVSADIPNNAANTAGNAATASKLLTPIYLNNILFDGSSSINNITANTPNLLTFSSTGLGDLPGSTFNGSVAKEISFNTIGAAPVIGSTNITTLGSISTGTWAANVIGSNYGGAGTNNGILKANGSGVVSVATAGTDFIAPFGSQTARYVFAAPNASNGFPSFRIIEASDIPLLNQNTTGNANTATSLATAVNINGVSFNGTTDITVTANTSNSLTFNNSGTGASSATLFNGASAKTISYNTIGAAPSIGSASIITLGNITTGTWSANVIGANYGGAGNNNGILKANGAGVLSVANAGTDFQTPLTFSSPLVNATNSISIPQASGVADGYLSSTDWTNFSNKIDLTQKAANNGVASLDANGKIPTSQIPSISFSSGYVVNNQSEMLALSSAAVGSIAIRVDNSKNYVLSGLPASTLSNWLELLMPVSIASVNGHTESSITLTSTDIAEGTNLYYTNTRARNAISALSPITYTAGTGVLAMPAATSSVAGYLTASDWNTFNNKLGTFTAQASNTFYAGPTTGVNAVPAFRSIVVGDVPILNQNTTGNAGTATKLAATKNINGVAFDGSADIIIASTIANAVTFNSSGSGSASPANFDGSLAKTISYNTIGASPLIGSSSLTTVGTITSGTWAGNVIDANKGGAGVVNGILKADGSGNVSAAVVGTDYIAPFASQTSKYFYAAPNAANGVPIFRAVLATDIPILNQNTTGNAGTATKLAATKNINGVAFDGTSDITISSNIANAVTFNNSGSGSTSPISFDGSLAKTISYNTIGASPLIGSSSLTTVGSITSGTWLGSIIDATHGGAGNVNGILKANGAGVVTAATAGTDFENSLTFVSPLTRTTNSISLSAATTTSNGYLTSSDWNLFNGKQASIVAGAGVSITGGNTVAIGQSVATSASPSFSGITISGLNVAGIVTNTAAGIIGTVATTGSGNLVRATSPTLVTPILGDATATSLNVGAIVSTSDITAKRFKLTMPNAITAATTTMLDLSTGNVFTINMGQNISSFIVNNPVVGTYLIKFVQDATGSRDVAFPVAWKWAGGVAPSLTNTASKLDIVTLIYDGTNYYATIVYNF
jgi:hypothetical protein